MRQFGANILRSDSARLVYQCLQAEKKYNAMVIKFRWVTSNLEQTIAALSYDLRSSVRDGLALRISYRDVDVGFDKAIKGLRHLQADFNRIMIGIAQTGNRYKIAKLKCEMSEQGFEGSPGRILVK